MASEVSEREKVYELFERAVKDYICKFLICVDMCYKICYLQVMIFFFLRKVFLLRCNAEIESKILEWSGFFF